MKPFRLVFIGAAALVALALIAAAIVFSSAFQTWAVRKALAGQTTVRVAIGRVDAGLGHVALHDVRVEKEGVTVVVPQIEVTLPVWSAVFGQQLSITQLAAKGWTVRVASAAAPAESKLASKPIEPAVAVGQAFTGVFSRVNLPFDLAVDAVRLEGEVFLPGASGSSKVVVAGGGLGAGREGKFELTSDATLSDPKVSTLKMRATVWVAMETPRTFAGVRSTMTATAQGERMPAGITAASEIAATRTATGENYSVSIATEDRQLLALQATLPAKGQRLGGSWKINVRDADVAPFAFGTLLPSFSAAGEGSFDVDTTQGGIRAQGRIESGADRLEVLRSELASLSGVKIAGEFDLTYRAEALTVAAFNATVATNARTVATIRALQPFSLDVETRKLAAGDPTRELFGLDLQGVPLGWAQPFVSALTLTGDDLRGELVATARSGGLNVRTVSPLRISALSVASGAQSWLSNVDLSLQASADYAPEGWQAEIVELTGKSGTNVVFGLQAKAGRLTGNTQPIKATGKLVTQLAALTAQPIAGGSAAVTAGEGTIDFAASLGATREVQATIALRDVASGSETDVKKWPALFTALRADISREGQITLHVPIQIEGAGRKSDVTLAGTVVRQKDAWVIDAQATSSHLVIDDAKAFAGLAPSKAAADTKVVAPAPDSSPVWTGLRGSLALAFKRVVYSESFEATDVVGTLRLVDGTMKLEGVRLGLGEGEAKLGGAVTFDRNLPRPYRLNAELALRDFDPGPLFRGLAPGQPPTVEGNFHIASRLVAHAARVSDLAQNLHGDFQLTSRGGIFRGLPVSVANFAEHTGTIAALIASAGNALSEITRRKENTDVVSKAQAVSELAKRLGALSYDQLNVEITRDESLDGIIKNLTLISPEVRLSGSGRITHRGGSSLLDDGLDLDFKLRARDQVANLLKRIGRLGPEPDELGYAACTLPLKVNGTLGRPQTGELNRALVAIALEKTGVTDKAADFVDRILGK